MTQVYSAFSDTQMEITMRRPCKPVLSVILAVMAMTSAITGAYAATPAEQAQVMYDRGCALSDNGDSPGAIAQWRKTLEQNERSLHGDIGLAMVSAETLTSLAEALRQSGQLDESLMDFQRVLRDYPECRSACADAAVGAGKIFQKRGENVKAIGQYLGCLTQYPERSTRVDLARGRISDLATASPDLPRDLQSSISKAFDNCNRVKAEDQAIKAAIGKAGTGKGAGSDLLELLGDPAVQRSYGRLLLIGDAQLAVGDVVNARITYERYLDVAARELDPEGYKLARIKTYYKLGDYSTVVNEAGEGTKLYAEGTSAMEFHYYLALGIRH
jgi:tetratricopeptide (TPR) repeat protein